MVIALLFACATKSEPRDTATVEPDADGDGFDAVAVGGDDCNDQDSRVNPEAEELCDGIDQNCDGDALLGSDCGAWLSAEDAGTPLLGVEAPYVIMGLVRDVTGDARADVVVLPASQLRQASLNTQAQLGLGDNYGEVGAPLALYDAGGFYAVEVPDLGDVNGDGFNDLGFSNSDGDGVFVHYGPVGPGEHNISGDADEVWPSWLLDSEASFRFGLTGVDLDGDGRADAVAENSHTDAYYDWNRTHQVFFGGSGDRECSVTFDVEGVAKVDPLDYVLAVDTDGDGLQELGLWAALYLEDADPVAGYWWVNGGDLRSLCDTTVQDLARVPKVTGVLSIALGDWSGDGVPEIVEFQTYPEDGEVAISFYHADDYVAGTSAEAFGSYLGDGDFFGDTHPQLLNIDGEGHPEMVLNGEVFRGGVLPGPNQALPDRRLRVDACAYLTCNGDFDGDGYDDMISPDYRDSSLVGVAVIPGFAVPWDDPAYW